MMNSFLRLHKFFISSKLYFQAEKTLICGSRDLHTSLIVDPRLRASATTVVSHRNFWETYPLIKRDLFMKDGMDREKCELIYRSKLFNYAFYGQLFSLCGMGTQIFGGSYYAYKYYVLQEIVQPWTHIMGYQIVFSWLSIFILGVFAAQNFLVFVAAQRALLRVYYKSDTDEYVFVSLANNPFKSRLTYCKAGELNPHRKQNLLSIFGNHDVKGSKFFIRPDSFRSVAHYNRLLSEHIHYD